MLGVFLDSEANGLNPQRHRLIEIALKIVDLGTGALKASYQSSVKISSEMWKASSADSLKIHGFTWEELQSGKEASLIAEEILSLFSKWEIKRDHALFICQNPSFDRAFFAQLIDVDLQETLNWPYHWLDLASMYWVESIKRGKQEARLFPWNTGISKDHIATIFHLAQEKKPHRASSGVDHLLLCYEALVGFPCK